MHVTLWHYAMNAMTCNMTINEYFNRQTWMAIEHEEEWGVVGRPLSLCAHAKCDLFQVVVLVILMFTRQLAQSGFECLIGSTINPDGQWLTIL